MQRQNSKFIEYTNKGEQNSRKFTKKGVKVLSLGDFLRYIRMRHNLTQSEFGELIYRSKDYVYLMETDKTEPSLKELQMISKKLNEPVIMIIMYGLSVSQVINTK
jgi:DNA-binding XRE family transcriptional regulator